MMNEQHSIVVNRTSNFLRLREVTDRIKVSKSTLYKICAKGLFPKPIKTSTHRATAWLECEVNDWILGQIACARTGAST